MEDTLIALYCLVDDFCKEFMPHWEKQMLESQLKKRRRPSRLSPSEIMTIYIHFHQSHYRHFKAYYLHHVCPHLKDAFPGLVSYHRFIELIKRVLVPLCLFSQTLSGTKTGVYFVDSLPIKVCHIKRAHQNKVFAGLAKTSRSSMGWYRGFKLHLVINDRGDIMAFKLTLATTDDRKPVPDLVKHLTGMLLGDKGYLSQALFDRLHQQGLKLITPLKKNMKNKLMLFADKWLLRKRGLIECVNDQLKNVSQIEHTRHRSVWNFIANILAALIAYMIQPKKPSLKMGLHLTS